MLKKVPLILISISLVFFFVSPTQISAQENQDSYWPLKEKEVENLLDIIRKEPLTDANRDLFFESLSHLYSDYPRKTGAVVLVKQAVLKEQLDYWFKEVPKQVSIEFLKVALKLVRIVYAQDIGSIIEIIEQVSVEAATDYAVNWFVQNDIKVGSGEASYIFTSYKGKTQELNIQYIIVYHPSDKLHGKIAAEFYSKEPIEPPVGTGPDALARTVDDSKTTCWPWDRWIENERKRDNDGKLEPFIIRVKGSVKRDKYGVFSWNETKEPPTVEVDFDNPVPEIEVPAEYLEKPSILIKARRIIEIIEKELARMQEKLATPEGPGGKIKEGWERSRDFFGEIGEGLKGTTLNLIDKIGSYLLGVKPEAQIVSPLQSLIQTSEPDLTKLTEEALSLEKSESVFAPASADASAGKGKTKLSLEELIEKFDEISERAEILLADAQGFLSRTEPEVLGWDLSEEMETPKEGIKEEVVEEEPEEKVEEVKEEQETPQVEITFCSISGSQYPVRNSIIFNEIAWMGTSNSSNDEWLEMKNISGSSVDLSGWQILDKDSQIKIFLANAFLNPGGFFLLERTDDDSVPGIPADLIYTGALTNTNEALYLFDENCELQDKVEASPYWSAGSNSSKKTMERKTDLGWQTSRYAGGTPKRENSSGEIYYGGGGSTASSLTSTPEPSSLPKLLISEIQIDSENGASDEFIELYNPNNEDVSLKWWSIQKATSNGSISKKNFETGNTILAKGYFLIVNSYASQALLSLADKTHSMTHSTFNITDNNTIFLVKSKDEIVSGEEQAISDKVGYGEAFSPEGVSAPAPSTDQSLGRKWTEATNEYQDTNNNQEDFEIQSPTPKAKNQSPVKDTTSPIAEAGPDQIVEINQPVSFDGSSSTDDVGIVSYDWDLGLTGPFPTLEKGFSATGTYVVTLQVADEAGNTSTDTLTVFVNPPPKILISEIQIESSSNKKDEFIELYNPNDEEVDISNWSIQKSYSTSSTFYRKNFEKDDKIPAKGYFLIVHGDATSSLLDLAAENGMSQSSVSLAENNTAYLVRNQEYIETATDTDIVDMVGFGENVFSETAPAKNPPADKSIGRKWSTTTETYPDTNNNQEDFEIQTPTPKAQNESDLIPPKTTIISAPPSLTNQTQATFSFSSNEKSSSFQCKLDTQDWGDCFSPIVYSGLASTSHTFLVKATDPAGNSGEPAQHNWTIDTDIESPILSLQDWDTTSTSYTNEQTVRVEITQDQEATAWFLSESSEKPTTSTDGWLSDEPSTFDLSVNDGFKTVYVWTKDAADNISELTSHDSITLDTISPQTFFDDKPLNPTNQTTAAFVFSSNEDNCSFGCKIDSQEWQNCSSSITYSTSSLNEGLHLFQVKATDQAGNTDLSPAQYSWLVDITPPSSQVESLATSSTSTNFTVRWSGSDTSSGILNYALQYYRKDSVEEWQYLAMATTSTSTEFTGQDEHTYYFRSRARDIAGNEESWPTQYDTFCEIEVPKDTIPPAAIFSLSAQTGTEPGEIILSWTAPGDDENIGQATAYFIKYFSEEITEGNWASSTQVADPPTPKEAGNEESFIVSGLADNTIYYFAIKSKDEVNNTSTISNSTSSETLSAILEISTTTLSFTASQGGENPQSQSLTIENQGKVEMNWSISTTSNWVLPTPASGTLSASSSTSTEISIDISGMAIGSYQATTTVETVNAKNSPQNVQINLTVLEPPNQPPIAIFTYPPEDHYIGQEITFDASDSNDPDDDPISFSWNFDDGTSTTTISEIITHSFATSGEFSVSLVVEDDEGATSSTSTSVQIFEKPKILISEVQINDKEFVELYNFGDELASTTGWYLSYFSVNREWNDPTIRWEFSSTTIIGTSTHYLIGLYDYPVAEGNPNADWEILTKTEPYHQYKRLSNDAGSIGIFTCDPNIATIAQAKSCKIDLVGWGEPEVREGTATTVPEKGKSLTRKQDENNNYIDTDNNSTDFEITNPTPTNSKDETKIALPPNPVENFRVASSRDNTVILTWSTTTDPDTSQENISYTLYWAQEQITEQNATSTSPNVYSTSTATTTLTLAGLDYNTIYYFGIRAFDGMHYSSVATTTHSTPLPAISNLNTGTSAIREAIDLFWTSPGTKKYLIKQGEKEIVESGANENQINWDDATWVENSITPTTTGEIESFTAEDLAPNQTYYFAIKSISDGGATSTISNLSQAKAIPGFQDNDNGTITDLYTGLVWVKDGTGLGANNGEALNWDEAKAFSNQLNFAGYDDWRLPNFKELASIVHYATNTPAVDENYFLNTTSSSYWTSSHKYHPASGCTGAYCAYPASWDIEIVDFNTGVITITSDTNALYYVRPVRGPDPGMPNILSPTGLDEENPESCNLGYTENGDGTITNNCTGLIWAKAEFAQNFSIGLGEYNYDYRKTWENAIKFANNRALCQDGTFQGDVSEIGDCSEHGGIKYDDFRLPNIREILEMTKKGNGLILPWTGYYDWYWSSTSVVDKAWAIGNSQDFGKTSTVSGDANLCVQIVRDDF